MNHKIFLLYDGVRNSVFQGQVLVPIKKRLCEDQSLLITIVSFERKLLPDDEVKKVVLGDDELRDRLRFVQLKRPPFFGDISLWISLYRFWRLYKRLLAKPPVIARGPFAGWIARKVSKDVTIQARGLAAEEFRYVRGCSLLTKFVYKRYVGVELEAYKSSSHVDAKLCLKIETVSPALSEYLVSNFRADRNKIRVSTYDVPEKFSKEQIGKWRKEVRKELQIDEDVYAYCYAGSGHAWQSVDETIDYFVKQAGQFLLVLSQDKEIFEKKLKEREIPSHKYLVTSVPHDEIYRYLSAADAGLLFRAPDIVNWVSRPTKLLEYQSVRLEIIHNETISALCDHGELLEKELF